MAKSLFDYRIFSISGQNVAARTPLSWLKHSSLWIYRALAWLLIAATIACAAVVLGLRYWLLPGIDEYREDISRAVSRAAGQRVSIEHIQGNWDGMRPHLSLRGVTLHDKADRPAFTLSRVDSTLSWRSLALGNVNFHALDIWRPDIDVRRSVEGVFSVAGVEVGTGADGGGLGDWVLSQRDIRVHDASISWTDEQRGTPTLSLGAVNLHLVNRGRRHRVGLRATPPADVAGPVDFRADFSGADMRSLPDWTGRLFIEFATVNLPSLKQWLPLPVEVAHGHGAVRAWSSISRSEVRDVIADLQLTDLRARMRSDLPELDMSRLTGRLSWKLLTDGWEFSTAKLEAMENPKSAGGNVVTLPQLNMNLRVTQDAGLNPVRGDLKADSVHIAQVVKLLDRMPVDRELLEQLRQRSPQGSLSEIALRWNGWPRPTEYSVRARFHELSMARVENHPGFTNLSGTVEGNEKGGTLVVNSQRASVDMPNLFAQTLPIDTFAGNFAWSLDKAGYEVRLNNVAFTNADVSGSVAGTYRGTVGALGEIDITGGMTRVDGRRVSRYIPVMLKVTRTWLERAALSGQSNDVKFRVKGKLADFPFPDNRAGIFTVSGRLTGGTLDYVENWPRIENLDADLLFRGSRMDITGRQGTILGARLSKVKVEIPDLGHHTETLTVTGEAEGPTADFIEYINRTPISGMIDNFTNDVKAQGRGRITLKLVLPLNQLADTKVAGAFQFAGNNIVSPDVPPLDQVNGRMEFTEASVRANVTAMFMGGPATINATTSRDTTLRVTLQGRANIDNVKSLGGIPFIQHFRGSTDWRGVFTVRRKQADLVIESNLAGVVTDLPAPLAKTAAEVMPLRIERRHTGPQQERLIITAGDVLGAQFVKRTDGTRSTFDRGVVRLGPGALVEPERPGVWLSGSLRAFDFDEWMRVLGDGDGSGPALAGVDVKFAELTAFNRVFHDAVLAFSLQGGGLQGNITSKEIEGTANWRSQGKGRLVAKLKRLVVPAAIPPRGKVAPPRPGSLPALDVTAEQFTWGTKPLGRLELLAIPDDRDWRIEKLNIVSAESTLSVDGVWRAWLTQPRTEINLKMDVTDIGQTFSRWGYPEGVRRGAGHLEAQLNWAGSPQEFDYPTLTGNVTVEATKGQFVKLEPGLGRLLGILSLQSLPRRITLDFRDIFSEGFAFDSISGSARITRGVAYSDSFRIQGPSASVAMSGEVDIARETQKLRVRVRPHLSDGLSIAGALIGGPIAGVAAFLAQKLLKDPLDQAAGFEYAVTGTWADPQVVRADREQTGAASKP
jgi:uncharacterized protein (TIGR02099 family)